MNTVMVAEALWDSLWTVLFSRAPELVLWTLSIAFYCLLIHRFYHFVAARDLFGFNRNKIERERTDSKLRLKATVTGFVEYGVLFPIAVFIWFAFFSTLLFFLAKDLPTGQILLVSISFVTAIRLVSYYSQDLSRDMAKLIPFVMLGVILVEPNFFSLSLTLQRIQTIPQFLPDLPAYFLFILLIEWALRILLALKHVLLGISPAPKTKPESANP